MAAGHQRARPDAPAGFWARNAGISR